MQKAGLYLQRVVWSRRATSWDEMQNPGLQRVVDEMIELIGDRPLEFAIDLGCGSGQLSIPLATKTKSVLALDIAPKMIDLLNEKLESQKIKNVQAVVGSVQQYGVTNGTVGLVCSNYVLHHLSDKEKQSFVHDAFRWLHSGGELIFGDMMFGRGATAEDRAVIMDKVKTMMSKGPGGYWRIAKNGFRYLFRFQEKPISQASWVTLLSNAGFVEIEAIRIVSEAGIIRAKKP
ncbi:putative methyltransferase YrrT [Acidithrix ferrooxidans]|uniref:Putative methyltransferase YrrT n=2 Tax=Acidimicrobiaceae TaxID=84994 RepID=A0A0D8HGJ2_9ACTN|nr:putative methyltransferase YrrT [Acidithrix ferrooxidans]